MRQMKTSEKPRDVSGVELLMNNHQGHKAEIEARQDNFEDCKSLGKELLSRNHYASNEIKEKLNELVANKQAKHQFVIEYVPTTINHHQPGLHRTILYSTIILKSKHDTNGGLPIRTLWQF